MNKESNKYTIIYASVMVVLVAVGLAFTSQVLKDKQHKNEDIDKMRQLLRAVNIPSDDKDADKKYEQYIVSTFVMDAKGAQIQEDAFAIDMQDELKKKEAQRKYPVFVARINNHTYYILALRGTGLWGPIWGYISLQSDKNTVYGADFSHQGETPGLGAEITLPYFSEQFVNKQIFKNGEYKSIAVVKAGKSVKNQDYVDGISGGTITSQGVNNMLFASIKHYESFLKQN